MLFIISNNVWATLFIFIYTTRKTSHLLKKAQDFNLIFLMQRRKMASHDNMYSSDGAAGQAQLRRDDQPGQADSQSTNFLNQTGEQVKTMAHGAADVASGAVQGTIFLAQGTAAGAANVAQGASDVMRSTFGTGAPNPSDPNHSGKRC